MNINELLQQYIRANLEFESIFEICVEPGMSVLNQRTMDGFCGIVIPIEGKARFTLEETEYNLEAGKILFAGSNLHLSKEAMGTSDWRYALIHYRVMNSKIFLDSNHQLFNIGVGKYHQIYQYMDQMKQNQEIGDKLSLLSNKGLLYCLIQLIIALSQEHRNQEENAQIHKFKNFIKDNLKQVITIQEIADVMEVDPKHLYYIFQKETGMCPKKYITKERMKRAKELLLDGKYNVSEVGEMVGYEDPLYFSRIFKKNMGVPPSTFRDNFGINPWKI